MQDQGHRRRRRPPADVQQLLDGLLFMQQSCRQAQEASAADEDEAKRKELLEWFASLSVEERVHLLQLQEPAVVKLVVMLARKAHGLPRRRGRRPCLVKFFVFAEAVPALAANAPARQRNPHGRQKEGTATTATAELFGEEPFVVRPDESRESAWGDPLRLPTRAATWRAWETLMEKLLLLVPPSDITHLHEPTPVGLFSVSLLQDAEAFFCLLEEASGGGFLRGGLAGVATSQELLGETAWFREKGDYTLGELLANKVELLLCRGWHKHLHGAKGTAAKKPARGIGMLALASPVSGYLQDRRALVKFLFEELSNREARMQCLATAVAKAAKAFLQQADGAEGKERGVRAANTGREAFETCRRHLEVLEAILQLHLFGTVEGSRRASTTEEALDRLFTTPLIECAAARSLTQCRVQALLRGELLEKRTSWHQQQLLMSFDVTGEEVVSVKAGKKKDKKKKSRSKAWTTSSSSSPAAAAPPPAREEDKEKEEKPPEEDTGLRPLSSSVPTSPPRSRESSQEVDDDSGKDGGGTLSVFCKEAGTQTGYCTEVEEYEKEEDISSVVRTEDAQEEGDEGGDYDDEEEAQSLEEEESGWATGEEESGSGSAFLTAAAAAPGDGSNETLLKDLCLKLEAEVATLRGVLAAQRGALTQGGGGSINNNSYPYPPQPGFAIPPYGYIHGPGPLNNPHQHPLFSRHGPHHMEIMSDDGRGDGGGGGSAGWQAGVPQPRTALASAHAHPFPLTSTTSTGNLYAAEGAKHHAPPMNSTTMGRRAHQEGGSPGGGVFAVSLPRNPSGPLQMWGKGGHQHPHQQQHQHHQPPQQHPLQHQQHPPPPMSASVSLGDDGGHYHHAAGPAYSLAPPLATLHHEHPAPSGLLDVSQHQQQQPPAAPEDCCTGFTLREPLVDMRSRVCMDMADFVRRVTEVTASRLPQQRVAVNRCRQVVQSLWPRAQVKAFGSFVSGLALPSSDVDLVICLPKVRKDAPAEAPGVLEGRNAIKETWQQELARRLRATVWVNPASIKIISHTAIPVIKMKMEPRATLAAGATAAAAGTPVECADTGDSMGSEGRDEDVYLDVSIEGGQHNGLLANRVIADLLRENPALRPLVLVLKHFMKERGLMESYSGGLSSYGLVLMVARYLQEQSPSMDTGSLLLGFLDFYSNHFDPRSMGISTNHRCYFSRGQQQPSSSTSSSLMHRRVSLGCGGELDMPEYYTPLSQPPQGQVRQVGPLLENPYKFDPLYIEDPICPSNNIGRNCFRIFQIQRAWNDAWRALDPSRKDGPPRLSSMLQGDGCT